MIRNCGRRFTETVQVMMLQSRSALMTLEGQRRCSHAQDTRSYWTVAVIDLTYVTLPIPMEAGLQPAAFVRL